ncbi:MAG: hypothetical protein Q9180_009884, partial [Flavoplaca navasiana]
RRRELAEMVAAEKGVGDGFVGGSIIEGEKGKGKGREKDREDKRDLWGYELGWCVNALEVKKGDLLRARGWLRDWGVSRGEWYGREKSRHE